MLLDSGCTVAVEQFLELLAWDWSWCLFDNPVYGSQVGHHDGDDRLQQYAPESFQLRRSHAAQLREELAALRGELPAEALLQCRVLMEQLREEEHAVDIQGHLCLALNCVGYGCIHRNLNEALDWMRLDEEGDFVLLIRRLQAFPQQIHGFIALLRESLRAGFRPPRCTIEGLPEDLRKALELKPPYDGLADVAQMPRSKRQQREVRDAVELCWKAGIKTLLTFVEDTYLKQASDVPGLWLQPQGAALYAAYLRHHTTQDLTPDEVHQMGLDEVQRLRLRLRQEVFEPLGHTGSCREFGEQLRADPQHIFATTEELLRNYERLLLEIQERLPQLFNNDCIPKTPIQVIEKSCGPACVYVAGTADGSRPGFFYVNPNPLDARPRYEAAAFALHEGMPGHHLQNSLCVENETLPNFLRCVEERRYEWIPARRQAYTAYQEGWALYAESLGEELGRPDTQGSIYRTPYDLFGKLSMEMKRAVRLVVDTGIHDKKWSLAEAIEYMQNETGMHEVECERECRRYAAWPGQAVSYKVGHRFFQELRRDAERRLGASFDLRRFHGWCLQHGPLPLDLLREQVDRAIKQQLAEASA